MSNTSVSSQTVELLKWIELYNLKKNLSRLPREFSDGVLLARILKIEFPRFVELHNYIKCNTYHQKIENWQILNKKVLSKLGISLTAESIEKMAVSDKVEVENVLMQVKEKVGERALMNNGGGAGDSAGNEKVAAWLRNQGAQKPSNMICYNKYKETMDRFQAEQDDLLQTIEKLNCLIKLKDQTIAALQAQLPAKPE